MSNWRINLVFLILIILPAALISRLAYLQVFNYKYYQALAQGQKSISGEVLGERGRIFLSDGKILATNVKSKTLFVSPKEIENKEQAAKIISDSLSLDYDLILSILKKDSISELIKQGIEDEDVFKDLQGFYLEDSLQRKYPQSSFASQIIGFLGGENEGQYGVEGYYNAILKPKEIYKKNSFDQDPKNGADIVLTLDYNIQTKAEQILKEAKEEFNIRSGQIIVADPFTGRIMAIANYPSFDLNKYSEQGDYQVFQDNTTQSIYEPGSVFKAFTMAAALDSERVTPQTTYVDPGIIRMGQLTISNFDNKQYGQRTMTEVLEKSINTGAVFAEKQTGHDIFAGYMERFGFFQPTRVDLQGEIYSENKEFKQGREINYATASFGQGIEITPMQLIRAFSVLANGGKMVKPYIVEKIVRAGKTEETQPEISESLVISQKTSQDLTKMLISVVEQGSAKLTRMDNYNIAGKTGTSEIPYSALGINKKGYSEETWQSFIGYAPAYNPKFLALVKLDSPQAKTSEISAVPVFRKIAEYIINYLEIPPDK